MFLYRQPFSHVWMIGPTLGAMSDALYSEYPVVGADLPTEAEYIAANGPSGTSVDVAADSDYSVTEHDATADPDVIGTYAASGTSDGVAAYAITA